MAIRATVTNNTNKTAVGSIPPRAFPGSMESFLVGRPKKYLRGPDLVISQDTIKVAIVDRSNTIGRDPVNSVTFSVKMEVPFKTSILAYYRCK